MKNMKALLCLALAGCLASTVLSGCQKDNSSSTGSTSTTTVSTQPEVKDPVTIAWWYRGNGEQADTGKVQDKVNELLKDYKGLEHVSIELHPFASTDYVTQVTLGQTAGQQIDILNTVGLSLPDQVKLGTYLSLDDYLPEMPELTDALPQWLLDRGQINGVTYMIPHYQQAANGINLSIPKVYADKYIDLEKFKSVLQSESTSTEEKAAVLEEYTRAVQAGEGKTKYAYPLAKFYDSTTFCNSYFDAVPSSEGTIRVEENSKKVIFYPFEEETKKAFEITARWYQEGLIAPDPTTNYDNLTKTNMLKEVSSVYSADNAIGSEEYVTEKLTKLYGMDLVSFPLKSYYYIGQTWAAGGDGVTTSSKNPEEAAKFIEAMDIERGKEIYNTIVYGLEGVHYEKIDDTHIKTLGYDTSQGGSDYLYSAHKWIMGNTFNAYLNQSTLDSEIAAAKEINESGKAKVSALAGLVFDSQDVSTQFSQIVAVHKEYMTALYYGSKGKDWEAYYNEYKSKIETAGIDEVLEHFQKQLDDFLK